jgi:hypothetical protein
MIFLTRTGSAIDLLAVEIESAFNIPDSSQHDRMKYKVVTVE